MSAKRDFTLMLLSYYLLLLSSVVSEANTTGSITCTSSGTVFEDEPAYITCLYNQDIEQNSQEFFIQRSQEGKDPTIMAICGWYPATNLTDCDLKHNSNITVAGHKVTLTIPRAQPVHTGNYTCATLPVDDSPRENCRLVVKEKPVPGVLSILCNHGNHQPSVTCGYSSRGGQTTLVLEKLTQTGTDEIMRFDTNTRQRQMSKSAAEYKPFFSNGFKGPTLFGVAISAGERDTSDTFVCRTLDNTSYATCLMQLQKDMSLSSSGVKDDEIRGLVTPLYLIFGCLVVCTLFVFVFVILSCRKRGTYYTETTSQENYSLCPATDQARNNGILSKDEQ